MTEHILTKIEDKVFHIILNRPNKKNALTRAMYRGLADAIEAAETDKNVMVILIYGNGDSFCAGNDIKDFQDVKYITRARTEERPAAALTKWLLGATKPVIAAIHGYAVGIGTTLPLNCDLIYASEDAKFGFPFVNLGLVPEFGSTFILPELIGKFRAAELFFLGDFFTAEEALKIGLVNKIFPKEELIEKVVNIAKLMAQKPPKALRSTKELINKYHKEILEKVKPEEAMEFRRRLLSPEAQEAFAAFVEKRKPDFSQFN
ncbi:MAG: enoyl-CoA hydratase [Candidatus Odinarchaeota archaeon]